MLLVIAGLRTHKVFCPPAQNNWRIQVKFVLRILGVWCELRSVTCVAESWNGPFLHWAWLVPGSAMAYRQQFGVETKQHFIPAAFLPGTSGIQQQDVSICKAHRLQSDLLPLRENKGSTCERCDSLTSQTGRCAIASGRRTTLNVPLAE